MRPIDMSEWDTYMKCMLVGRNAWDDYDRGYMDALDQADDWLDAQPAATLSEWISVKDKMPPKRTNVLTCDHYGNMHIMFHGGGEKYPFNIPPYHPYYYTPTHWMPLPEPPVEE